MIFTNFSGDCLQRYNFYGNTHFSLGKSGQGGKGALRLTLWKDQPVKQGQTTTPGTPCPTLYDKCVGFLTSPADHITLKMQETGATIYRPYPRRLERLTICRCHCKGIMFSSVILRPWVVVRSRARTRDLPHSSPALYQLSLLVLSGKAAEVWFSV